MADVESETEAAEGMHALHAGVHACQHCLALLACLLARLLVCLLACLLLGLLAVPCHCLTIELALPSLVLQYVGSAEMRGQLLNGWIAEGWSANI